MTIKSSIDPGELNKFNKTYFQWWDKDGEFKILHKINPVRIDYIISKIKHQFHLERFKLECPNESLLENIRLLDVGCGGGLVTVPMYHYGANVTGLDANIHNIKAASAYAESNHLNINYIHTTIEEHATIEVKYDVVLCLEVIEHVANPEDFIINLSKLLSPGGILIISTINRTVKSYLQAIIAAEYILGWVPLKTHDYNKFLKPSELVRMTQVTDLNIEELKGLVFSVIDQKWYIQDDIDVNYFAVFGRQRAM